MMMATPPIDGISPLEWVQSLAPIIIALVGAIFGPNLLNRRNQKQITRGQVNKDEASAAQTIQIASVSLIEQWQKIASTTEAEAKTAEERAEAAEQSAWQAERKAESANHRAERAEAELARVGARVVILEDALRRAGISPPL